jgi:creatinine amidohydrolase/Fe(II)-dependent formamide hydrolase-like protein
VTPTHERRRPLRLADLDPERARDHLARLPRLIVPVGTMVSRGPRVPLGADTFIVERGADDLSAELGVIRAPAIPFGVHARRDPDVAGSASLTRKTLHRLMNELIAAWETEAKVTEFVILTTHNGEAHQEALSTIRSTCSVRLIDIFQPPLIAAGVDTAPIEIPLLAWLCPGLVSDTTMADQDRGQVVYKSILERLIAQLQPAAAA